MTFVDIFAAAVPTANKQAYIAHATTAAAAFMAHGALSYIENWGVDVPPGELTSFPKAVEAGKDETVVVGWAVWPSKQARDEAMPKVMQDERMAMASAPFDGKRLIFGGFETILEG